MTEGTAPKLMKHLETLTGLLYKEGKTNNYAHGGLIKTPMSTRNLKQLKLQQFFFLEYILVEVFEQ